MSERDLFRAIVLSGAALVSVPGCSCATDHVANDAATADAGSDAAVVADAGTDAAPIDEHDTGMVVIL